MSKSLIVGFDPGITTGLAILDIRGGVLFIGSKREANRSDVIKKITKFGKPLIVASDVNPLPQSVEKLASSVGSRVYYPEESLRISEKVELTRDHEIEIKNHHERDALAAAIKAYKNYRSLFLKIEQTVNEIGSPELFEDVARKVVKEDVENIMDGIDEIVEKKKVVEEPKVEIKKTVREEDYQKLIEKLQERLKQKDSDLKIVRDHVQKLQEASHHLKRRLEEARATKIIDEEINRLWHRISLLEKELAQMKKMNELMKMMRWAEEDGLIPLVEIEDFSTQNLVELNRMIDLKNRIVFSNCPDAFTLNQFGIRALVRKTPLNEKEMEQLEFPVIVVAEEQIEKYEEIKTIKQDLFEKEIKTAKKTGLIEWLKGYRKRRL